MLKHSATENCWDKLRLQKLTFLSWIFVWLFHLGPKKFSLKSCFATNSFDEPNRCWELEENCWQRTAKAYTYMFLFLSLSLSGSFIRIQALPKKFSCLQKQRMLRNKELSSIRSGCKSLLLSLPFIRIKILKILKINRLSYLRELFVTNCFCVWYI